jgi:hypothetical protein
MFKSTGILQYYDNPYKLIVTIDSEIANFYRSLIPKYIIFNRPMYAPHISVVRKEVVPNLDPWGKYHEQEICFDYENYIYISDNYLWLNVYSTQLENIRLELGMSNTSQVTKSPDGQHRFHTTIGNFKKLTPDNTRMICISPIRLHRRQLHVLQFAKGNKRKAYGSTKSLEFKRGSLVKHIKFGYTYVGGTNKGKVSLHSITTGERLTKCAKTKDIKFKSHNIWRVKVL